MFQGHQLNIFMVVNITCQDDWKLLVMIVHKEPHMSSNMLQCIFIRRCCVNESFLVTCFSCDNFALSLSCLGQIGNHLSPPNITLLQACSCCLTNVLRLINHNGEKGSLALHVLHCLTKQTISASLYFNRADYEKHTIVGCKNQIVWVKKQNKAKLCLFYTKSKKFD